MSQDRKDDLTALDRELAQMSQDVPDMPDDFHTLWTERIRAEAAEAGQAETGTRRERRRQWRYLLGAAAVFVFLIGGTLLTRRSWNRDLPASSALSNSIWPQETSTQETETTGTAREDGAEPLLYAMNIAAEEPAEEEAADAAEEAVYGVNAAAGAAGYRKTAASAPKQEAAPAATSAPAPEPAFPAAESIDTEESAADAADAGFPDEPEEEEPQEEVPEEPEQAPENGVASFLKDLGIFTLKTLAVALCCAALAFLAALVHRTLKNRKQKKGGSPE